MNSQTCYFQTLLLLLLLQSATVVKAQYTYKPFVGEGKVWNLKRTPISPWCTPPDNYDYQYVMKGDTAIGGDTMKKVFLIDEMRFQDNECHYFGAVKEENKVVSILYEGQDTLTLLYDFENGLTKLAQADPYPAVRPYEKEMWMMINSICRHVSMEFVRMSKESDWEWLELMEGIGFTIAIDPFTKASDRYLVSCYEDGICVFLPGELARGRIWPDYGAMLKDGRSWKYRSKDSAAGPVVEMLVKGDTILTRTWEDGKNREVGYYIYKKVYRTDESMYGDKSPHYYAAMSEVGGDVYCVMKGDSLTDETAVLHFSYSYPFSINPEESNPELMQTAYCKIDSVTSCGNRYRRITLELYQGGWPLPSVSTGRFCHWMEGIGSDRGILGGFTWDVDGTEPFEVYDGDVCVYNHSELYSISGGHCMKASSSNLTAVFDLQGRRLKDIPTKGLYIRNGKKHVIVK